MDEEELEEKCHQLYIAYGSETGWLFGIPPHLRSAVQAVIKVILSNQIDKQKVKDVLLLYKDSEHPINEIITAMMANLGID
jgi:hypothetical protein